jgi:hypothetical protein
MLLDKSGYVTKRKVRKIIRFRHYSQAQDLENYWREQLMLFVPWRNEEEELLSLDDIVNTAKENLPIILENSQPFYHNREIDDELLQNIVTDIDNMSADEEEDFVQNDNELVDDEEDQVDEFVAEHYTADNRKEQFMPPKLIEDREYYPIMRSLNDKQQKFVLNVLHLMKTSNEGFYQFLSGGAGVGKSHAITAIVQSCLRHYSHIPSHNPEQLCILVAAPTGKAAFNVFGMTLHCSFKLPPNQAEGKLCDLEDGVVNTIRMKLINTKLFIIDEISMVSVRQFYQIDQRLRQLFSCQKPFGGRSLLVVGHLRQLPPIAGRFVFQEPSHLPMGNLVGNHLWENFRIFELDQIMRQRGDHAFCKALNNMSEGVMDEEDVKLIKSREISSTNQPPEEAIWLFTLNAECGEHNSIVHTKLNTEWAMTVAHDKIEGEKFKKVKYDF